MKSKKEIFDSLISENLDMLRATAYRILGNSAEVDDAVQDALIIAWKKFSQFRFRSKLSSWVYRITVNHCCNLVKKRKKEADKLKIYQENISEPEIDQELHDRVELLRAAITNLPKIYRDSIVVGVLSDMSSEKAAALLGCSVNTLYQRIFKAKQMLKNKLEA